MPDTKIVPIPIPINGLNTVNPFLPLESGFARELTNYAILNGKLRVRPAVTTVINDRNSVAQNFNHFYSANGSQFYAIANNGAIYDVNAGTTGSGIGGACQTLATYVKHLTLDYVIGCRAPRLKANPFTAWTMTPIAGITDTAITCACSHKGRLYYSDGSTIQFTSLGQITNPVTVALDGGILDPRDFMDGQTILRIFSMTINPGNSVENVLVIFGSGGKVLIYSGDYPIADNWDVIGKYDMPAPINITSFLEIDGDIFIASVSYAYWAADLIRGNSQTAYADSPSLPIENLWQQYASLGNSIGIQESSFVYYLGNIGNGSGATAADNFPTDCIVVQFGTLGTNFIANYQNEAGCLVYFRKYKSWALWLTTPMFKPVLQYANTYFGTGYGTEIMKFFSDGVYDQWSDNSASTNILIETSWKTLFISAFDGVYQALNSVRVFFHNASTGYFHKIRAIFNFSDYNSPYGFYSQSTVTQTNPGNYTEGQIDLPLDASQQYSPFLGIGGAGLNISLQMTQKAQLEAYINAVEEIYGAMCVVSDGGTMV